MKLVICGDSHAVALAKGFRELGTESSRVFPGEVAILKLFSFPVTLQPFFERRGEELHFLDARVSASLSKLIGVPFFSRQHRDIVFALCGAFTTTILVRGKMWRSWTPYEVGASGALMSRDAMRAIARAHFSHVLQFYAALQEMQLNVLAIAAPPPRQDDPAFADSKQGARRLLVDRIAREVVAGELAAMGVHCVEAPEEAFTESGRRGYLRPDFYSTGPKDFHHADAAYGKLMLQRVAQSAVEHFAPHAAAIPAA